MVIMTVLNRQHTLLLYYIYGYINKRRRIVEKKMIKMPTKPNEKLKRCPICGCTEHRL